MVNGLKHRFVSAFPVQADAARERSGSRDAMPVQICRSLNGSKPDPVFADRRARFRRSNPQPVDSGGIADQFGIFTVADTVCIGREQFLTLRCEASNRYIDGPLFNPNSGVLSGLEAEFVVVRL